MKTATIIPVTGATVTHQLDKKPTLADYYRWISTDVVQSVTCKIDGKRRTMVIDEEGKIKGRLVNDIATNYFLAANPGVRDVIVGTAVVLEGYRL